MALAVSTCGLGPADVAFAQARGVIIQIPDDVMPGAPRPAPPAAPAPPPATSPAGPDGVARMPPGCHGTTCANVGSLWHVLNTSNRTCLSLSRTDLNGGKSVRKLATLLPPPQFVVAAGGCP